MPTPTPKNPFATGASGGAGSNAFSSGAKSGSANPFATGGGKVSKTPEIDNNPWAPVLSFGQTLIDVISTPLYFVEGGISAAQKGKNPIAGAAENAVAWTQGKRPNTGSDILKNAGMSNDFWSSLAADIALDPLTYTPGVVISAPIKAALAGTRYALKGGSAAAKGAVSVSSAGAKAGAPVGKAIVDTKRIGYSTESKALRNTQLLAKRKMDKVVYQPVAVEGSRSVTEALQQMLASSLEAGYKGAQMSWNKSMLKEAERKIGKAERKAGKRGEQIVAPLSVRLAEKATQAAEEAQKTIDSVAGAPEQVAAVANEVSAKKLPSQVIGTADVAPQAKAATPLEFHAATNVAAPQTTKAMQQSLAKVDKIVKGITGTSVGKTDVLAKLDDILSEDTQKIYAGLNKLSPENRTTLEKVLNPATREATTNIIETLRRFAVGDRQQKDVVKLLGNKDVYKADGTRYTINEILTKPEFGGLYGDIDKGLTNDLESKISDILKASKSASAAEAYNFYRVSGLINEKVAADLKAAGALNPAKPTDMAKYDAAIAGISAGGQKKYANFDEFIAGLRSMDVVDVKKLQQIAKAIDPEHAVVKAIEAGATSKNDAVLLRNMLIREGANTVESTKRSIALANPEEFFAATKVGFKDAAVNTLNDSFSGVYQPEIMVEMNARESHAAKLLQYNPAMLKDASESLGRGMKPQFDAINKGDELESAGLSRLGEAYVKVKGAKEGPENVVAGVFNQHVASYVTGSILAKESYRRGRSVANAALKGEEKAFATTRLNDFILRGDMAESVLIAGWGARPVHVKAIAKLRGGIEDAYHHYVTVTDTARIFREAGDAGAELFNKMMFPVELFPKLGLDQKLDSVSYQALGDVVSDVLQNLERGTVLDPEVLVAALKTPAPGKTWTKEFQKIMDEAAPDAVKFIIDNKDAFKNIHVNKLKAETLDMLKPAQRFSDEITLDMMEMMDAMTRKGISSEAERHQIVYTWIKKFSAASRIFGFSNGEVAKATLRSVMQAFMEMTELNRSAITSKALEEMKAIASGNPAASEAIKDFTDALHTMPTWDVTDAHKLDGVSQDAYDLAQDELTGIMDQYAAIKRQLTTDMSPTAVKAWRQKHDASQAMLVAARLKADNAGVPTYYWNPAANDWVAADAYNHTASVKAAAQSPNRYIVTEAGRIDVTKYMTDTPTKRPNFKTHGVKHTQKSKAYWEAQSRTRRKKNAANASAQAAENTSKLLDEIEKMLPDDELAQVERAQQERFQQEFQAGEMVSTQEVNTPEFNEFFIASTYDASKTGAGRISTGARVAERANQGSGMNELVAVANKSESTFYNAIGAVDEVLKNVVLYFRKNNMTSADFSAALSSAISKTPIDDALQDPVSEMARQLSKLYSTVDEYAKKRGIMPKMLQRAFAMRGLNEATGIPNMDEFGSSADIAKLFQLLPIADTPDFLIQAAKDADPAIADNAKDALNKFLDRKEKFMAKADAAGDATSPVALLHNVISAIQFAGREMTLADSIVNNFNYAADGLSLAAAKKSGDYVFVRSTAAKGGSAFSVTHHFPETVEGGNYFHKDIAAQIGALDRSYNYTFGKNMAPWLKNMMGVLSFFKATQTILRPGHLVANNVGDFATVLMTGCGPTHIGQGFRLGMKFAGQKIEAEWKRSGTEARFNQLVSGFTGLAGRELKTAKEGEGVAIIYKGKKITLDDDYTLGGMRDNNVMTDDIAVADSLGHYDDLSRIAPKSDAEAQLNNRLLQKSINGLNKSKAVRAYEKVIKPAGDTVAYMGNGYRAATALRIMQSKNWESLDAMWAAVNKEVNLYHPTIQSLSAYERKTVRPLFTYYTWLRGAHNAFIKMATDHTAAMVIPSKIFYNQALANEMGPGSMGNLWGNKEGTPDYLNYSVYGPTIAGPRGAMVYRPSILPLDILDNTNLTYDSTKSLDQNTFNNLTNTGRMLGKNINLLAQPVIEFATGTDVGTGKPSTVKDLKTAGEELFSNIGTVSLLKGLGLYTPSNKGPESPNPLVDRDREILRNNFGFGMRMMDVGTPANLKYGESDTLARQIRLYEELMKKKETEK